jgi:hypothetical protein
MAFKAQHESPHKRMSLECDQDHNPPTVFRPSVLTG